MNTETKEQPIEVVEEKDGSAVAELPEELVPPEPEEKISAQEESDEDHPDDTDAIRAARRARRRAKKEYIKKTNEEKDQRLAMLMRRTEELEARLAASEQKTKSADLARLESAISDEETKLEWYRRKMQEATDNSNGAEFTKAQEAWYESRRRVEAMHSIKNQAVQSANADNGAANPRLVKLANQWMERNPWYDPNGGDEDSAIAK
jgi:hypothetical protein